MRVTARSVGAAVVVVVAGAAEVGARTVVAVAARCVPLELAHAPSPSAAARLIAARTRRRQAGISANRNRDGAEALRLAHGIDRTAVRREWDSNPRRVAPHTLSKRADSAALASLPRSAMVGDAGLPACSAAAWKSEVARSLHVSGDPAALERFR